MELKEEKSEAVKSYRKALAAGDHCAARAHMVEAMRLHELIYPDWRNDR